MRKNIIGDWGTELSDPDYARALAALGCLESRGTKQHRVGSDSQKILAALQEEFKDGDRTVIWRDAQNVQGITTPKSWRETIHENAQVLAEGWGDYLKEAYHPRLRPRLAVRATWRSRPDLFDFDGLLSWLGSPDVDCEALVLALDDVQAKACQTLWHWPLHVGVPGGVEGEELLATFREVRSSWIEHLSLLQTVGEARDSCDLLIIPSGMAARLMEQPRLRLRASFAICLDPPIPWSLAGDSPWAGLRKKLEASGIALVGQLKGPDLAGWYKGLIRELSHDLPVHAAVWRACPFPRGTCSEHPGSAGSHWTGSAFWLWLSALTASTNYGGSRRCACAILGIAFHGRPHTHLSVLVSGCAREISNLKLVMASPPPMSLQKSLWNSRASDVCAGSRAKPGGGTPGPNRLEPWRPRAPAYSRSTSAPPQNPWGRPSPITSSISPGGRWTCMCRWRYPGRQLLPSNRKNSGGGWDPILLKEDG